MNFASAPSYTTLETGLDPAQTGKITAALDAKGIGYRSRTTARRSRSTRRQIGQARIALAGAGLPGVGQPQPGFELLDKSEARRLATSSSRSPTSARSRASSPRRSSRSRASTRRTREPRAAQPAGPAVRQDEPRRRSAAVLLSDSGSLDPGAVTASPQLVASSVKGLPDQNVTITDSSGALLWPTSGAAAPAAAPRPSRRPRSGTTPRWPRRLTALLAQTLGPGKAQVQVNADLNADQATADKLTYGKKGVPLTQQTQTETLKGGGGGARRHRRHGANSRPTPRAAARRQLQLQAQDRRTRPTASTRPSPHEGRARRGQQPDRRACWSTSRSRPSAIAAIKSAVAERRRHRTPSAATRLSVSQVAFAKPPAPRRPARSPTDDARLRQVRRRSAWARCCFLFFVHAPPAKREGEALGGRADLAARDRGAAPARRARGRRRHDGDPTDVSGCARRVQRAPAPGRGARRARS